MSRRLISERMVGRSSEVQRIREALASARSGQPRHVLIGGEAGVGKTRLLEATADSAVADGARVLTGGCVSLGDSGLPFAPYAELLSALVAEEGAVEVARIAGHATPELARFAPSLGEGSRYASHEPLAQTRIFEALLELLRGLAAGSLLYLRIEDLHWADAGTLAATSFLLTSIRDEPIAIVATYRTDEITRRHPLRPWLAEMGRLERVERLDLEPLDEAESRELVFNIAGTHRNPTEIADIHRRADGNPYYVEELLATTAEARPLPATLRDVLLARVDALEPSAGELLGVAAVGGREVAHEQLTAAAGAPASLAGDLRALVDAGLIVTTSAGDADGYSFRHALLQEAVYDATLPNDRRRLHRLWAQQLDYAGIETAAQHVQLAHHLRAARDPRALAASISAGEAASASYSFEIAAKEYEAALELWEGDPLTKVAGMDHIDILEAIARSWLAASVDRRALVASRDAIAMLGDADPARKSELHVLLARVLWVLGDWGASTEAYEQAVRIAPDGPTDARTRALAGLGQVYMLNGNFERSRAYVEEAVERARATGNRELEGHGLNTLGVDLAGLGRVDEGIEAIDRALEIALEVGIADDIGRAYVNRGDILHWAGRLDEAVEASLEGIEAVGRLGMAVSYGAYIRQAIVYFGFTSGRWELAREQLEMADRLLPTGHDTDQYRAVYALQFLAACGDPAAAQLWSDLRPRLDRMPPSEHTSQFYCGGLELAILDERYEDALSITDDALELLSHIDGWFRLSEVCRMGAEPTVELGLRARQTGDGVAVKAAEVRLDRLAALAADVAAEVGSPGGSLRRELELDRLQLAAERGRLAGTADPDAWSSVADGWAELGQVYLALRARWRAAEAADAAGDRERATTGLREAHVVAVTLGARPLAARIEATARRLRVRLDAHAAPADVAKPDRHDRADFGLTKREREVLSLVALGRTNKQIAAELFISDSTAGVHVSNILGKLGVGSRTEAANVALTQGLVDT